MASPRPLVRRLFREGLCALILLCVASHLHASPPDDGWSLAWSDEFNGTSLDTSIWSYFSGTNQGGTDDTGPPTVTVSNGALNILTWTNSGVIHTGWIWSQGFTGVYGYWEARIKFNESSGEYSAFWLQPDSINTVTSPPDPADNGTEIDIVEHRSRDASGNDLRNDADINLHWDGYGSSEVNAGPGTVANPSGTTLQGNWHTYGMRWTPSGYDFYIDGLWVGSSTSGISMRAQWIYLSTFVNGSSWAGPTINYGTTTSSTTDMQVDYVRYYLPSEMISNANFEGRKQPWTGNNSAWSTAAVHGGTGSMALSAASAQATASQLIYGLLPNTGYSLSGWVKGNASIGVSGYGGSTVTQAVSSSSAFAQGTVSFTTGSGNRSATALGQAAAGSGTSYLDDFLLLRAATVNNGSLESGDSTAWYLYGTTSVARPTSTYGGLHALSYTAGSALSGSEQGIVGLTPGAAYRLSAWAMTSGTAVNLGVKGYNGSAQVSTAVNAASWTRGTVDFTTGSASTNATVFGYRAANATGTGYADSFFLYQPLASPWADQDITAIPLGGVGGTLGSRYVMQASGAGISGTSDRCHFIYQPVNGNTVLTAQLVGIDSNNPAAAMGIMIRSANNSYVPQASMLWHPGGTLELNYRTANSGTSATQTISGVTAPPWVRLTRHGSDFQADYSTDGSTWTRLGEITVPVGTAAEVGLVAASGDTTVLVQPVFDNVSIVPAAPQVSNTLAGPITVTGASTWLSIAASVFDDTTPSVAWSVVSGPGTVTFANPGVLSTAATFSQPGVYVLQCAATDSYATGNTQVTVIVTDPADTTLSLWLKLNEYSGATVADSSAYGNNGILTGNATWKPTGGVIGGDLLFDGTDSYVTVPDANSLDVSSAFTLSYWCYINSLSTVAALVSKRNGISDNNAFTTFVQTDSHLNVDIDTSNDRFTSKTLFALGTWYHVAIVFDGTLPTAQRAKLYVNGALDVTAAESSASIPAYTSAIHAGLTNSGSTAFFNGYLDDVRLYQRALTAAEVGALDAGLFTPVVSTGAAPTPLDGTTVGLAGAVANDLSGTLTTAWTQLSGPGTASFGNAASPATTAVFSRPGTYVLRLTATNTAGTVARDLTVNVAANPNIFTDWIAASYPGVTDTNVVGPLADPDLDGVSNLLEWALGLDPTKNDAAPYTLSQNGLPIASWTTANGTTFLALTVRIPLGRIGVSYSAQVSGDLQTWTTVGLAGAPVYNGDGTETLTFQDSVAQNQSTQRFIRLKVTQ